MSRIYFHSPSGEAEVRGWERAWMGGFVEDVALGLLHVDAAGRMNDQLFDLLPARHYLRQMKRDGFPEAMQWAVSYRTAWRVGGEAMIEWRGQLLDTWDFSLNTVMAIGNDAARLFARLHAQCEIHAWVDGPHRAWLAGIIEEARALDLARPDSGWESAIELLRARDDEPVVTSYSVCDQFPNSYIAEWEPADDSDEAADAWYDLPADEQWQRGMSGLRAAGNGLQMRPADWATMRFGHKLSVLDLLARDYTERLDRATGFVAAGFSEPGDTKPEGTK